MGNIKKESIAIAGIGCMFPGNTNSPDNYWKLLLEGQDTVGIVPASRWDAEALYHPDSSVYGRIHSKYGSFLSDYYLENFDPLFFGLTPLSAVKMDVQQRWLLETTYRALEDAGLRLNDISGENCGVYIGVSAKEYGDLVMGMNVREIIDGNSILGNSPAICSNRISYTFNLKGPSVTMDTACSSSLVALHMACQAIWRGEIDSAIVGAVNTILGPEVSLAFSTGGYLSPDGRCKAFDHRANGYVRAEGCGIVYLCPQSKADKPYASIIGTALTQDGFTVGLSMPNKDAQAKAIMNACADADLSPDMIQYIEAHGTGTKVGDLVEAESIGTVGKSRAGKGKLLVGSVKTNIGHCEPASGMAGLIKLALSIQHGRIPANLHMEKPNPEIPFNELNIEVPVKNIEWPGENGHRYGGINSFGFGGTNGHALLASIPVNGKIPHKTKKNTALKNQLFVLSAKNKAALDQASEEYVTWLKENPDLDIDDVCATQILHRSAFPYRLAMPVSDTASIAGMLSRQLACEEVPGLATGRAEITEDDPGVVFVFSGQGGQWWGMGRELLETSDAFVKTIRECARIMQPLTGWDLEIELKRDEEESIVKTSEGQLALLGLQMGLCSYWESLGLKPAAVVGHSLGEVPAAWAAGIITMEEAVQIIYYRMLVLEKISQFGTMLAVGLSEKKAEEYLRKTRRDVEIATVNGVNLVVLSGNRGELEIIEKDLTEKSIYAKFLKVTGPFHSKYIDQYKNVILDQFVNLAPKKPRIPFYSTVWGAKAEKPVFDAEYAFLNLRQRVKFVSAISRMIDDGWTAFVEIGPHPILAAYVSEIGSSKRRNCLALPTLRRQESDSMTSLTTLSTLYVKGYPIELKNRWSEQGYDRLKPPTYPFQREKCWLETTEYRKRRIGTRVHPLIKARTDSAGSKDNISWRLGLYKKVIPWIAEHIVQGNIIFPAAGICETALACGLDAFGDQFIALENMQFRQGLYIPKGDEELQEIVLSVYGEEGSFKLASRPVDKEDWSLHSLGQMRRQLDGERRIMDLNIDEMQAKFSDADKDDFVPFYEKMVLSGLDLGPSFRAIRRIWLRKGDDCIGEAYAEIEPDPRSEIDMDQYYIHPAVLDSCWQIMIPAIVRYETRDDDMLCLPVSVGSFKFLRKPTGTLRCYGKFRKANGKHYHTDVWIFDSEGNMCFEILDFTVRQIEGTGRDLENITSSLTYRPGWEQVAMKQSKEEPCLPDGMESGGLWVVFADGSGYTEKVQKMLKGLGEKLVSVSQGDNYSFAGENASIRADSLEDFRRLFSEICADGSKIRGSIFAWALDSHKQEWDSNDGSALALAGLNYFKAFTTDYAAPNARIWVLTNQGEDPDGSTPSPVQNGLIGLARVALHENLEISTSLVDVDVSGENFDMDIVSREFLYWPNDEEIAYRGKERLVRKLRLINIEEEATLARREVKENTPFTMHMAHGYGFDGLGFKASVRQEPGEGYLEVRVLHVPVHIIDDTVSSIGKGSITEEELFIAYSGIVERVGKGVKGFKAGDRICGLGLASASSYILADPRLARKLAVTEELTSAPAYASEVCLAYMSLESYPKTTKGDKVLLVVGPGTPWKILARMAERRGCNISLATPDLDYHALLQDSGFRLVKEGEKLDADAVFCMSPDSSLYNASRSLRLGGKIVVTDIECLDYERKLSASFLSRTSSLAVIDLRALLKNEPDTVINAWAALQSGSYRTDIGQIERFSAARIKDAIIAARGSLSNVILDIGNIDGLKIDPLDRFADIVSSNASYIVTGGCKGIGLEIAKDLARNGAGSLILASRSGAKTTESIEGIAEIESHGCKVHVLELDISLPDSAVKMFSQKNLPPVKGVVHCAAVFDDALIQDMDRERFMAVYAPKATGAYNLHMASRSYDLDFFVCFSSVSAAYGNPSQANYAAANAFMDALCLSRRNAGLAGLSMAWGVIGGAGYLTRAKKVADMLELQGWRGLELDELLYSLRKNILEDTGYRLVMDLDWSRMALINPADLNSPRFRGLMGKSAEVQEDSLHGKLTTLAYDEAQKLLENAIKEQIARIIGMKAEDIDEAESITALGLDSLMINQLRNWLVANTKVQITMMKLMMGPSIRSLGEMVMAELGGGAQETESDDLDSSVFSSPIPSAPEAEYYVVSSSQRRVLMLSNIDVNRTNYNVQMAVRIRSSIDLERAEAAFHELVRQNDSLRTSFHFIDGDFMQRIETDVEPDVTVKEFSEDEADIQIMSFCRPFDLSKAPLIRVLIGKMGEDDYLLVIEAHHAIADGTSAGPLLASFFQLYEGKTPVSAPIRYVDYCVWQYGLKTSGAYKSQEEFWKEQLAGEIPVLSLPLDFPRPARQTFDSEEVRCHIGPGVFGGLKNLASRTSSTLPMVLLAVFKSLLYRYTGDEDIIVGMPVAARNHPDLELLIGQIVNTIPIRSQPKGFKDFLNYLVELRKISMEAYDNQDYPFDDIYDLIDLRRDLSRNPIFDVSFVYQGTALSFADLLGDDGTTQAYPLPRRNTGFDLALECFEISDGLDIALQYSSRLFRSSTMTRMIAQIERIIETVVAEPHIRIGDLPLDIPVFDETATVMDDKAAGDSGEWSRSFADTARQHAARIALTDGQRNISYSDLLASLYSLAARISSRGVQLDETILVLDDGSLESFIAFMAAAAAGFQVFGVLPEGFEENIGQIVSQNYEAKILAPETWQEKAGQNGLVLVDWSLSTNGMHAEPFSGGMGINIVTSGTDGNARWVALSEQNIMQYCRWHKQTFSLESGDICAQYGPLSSARGIGDSLAALLAGATVIRVPGKLAEENDIDSLVQWINNRKISFLHIPALMAESLIRSNAHLPGLRTLVSSGDMIVNWVPVTYDVYNLYSLAEAGLALSCHKISEPATFIPVGKPLPGAIVRVMDRENKICPVGVFGEICVCSAGMAEAYINAGGKQTIPLIPDPVNSERGLIRTGDRARWIEGRDGGYVLELLGRVADSARLNGYLVEMGEIEAAIMQLDGVYAAKAMNIGRNIAVFWAGDIDENELRQYLRTVLPESIQPEAFCHLEAMPLTSLGTIDRSALRHLAEQGFSGSPDIQSASFAGLSVNEKLAAEYSLDLGSALAARVRDAALGMGVTVSSFIHVSWAMVVASYSDSDEASFALFNPLTDRIEKMDFLFNGDSAESVLRATDIRLQTLDPEALKLDGNSEAGSCSSLLYAADSDTYLTIQYPVIMKARLDDEKFTLSSRVLVSLDPVTICSYMQNAITGLVKAAESSDITPIRDMDIMPETERELVIRTWNETRADFPTDKCIHELFQEQVKKSPDATAISFEGDSLSYAQLDKAANCVAHQLRSLGVGPDRLVAICTPRSLEMMIGLLGILKAGGAYVPLDPGYPAERLEAILEGCSPIAMLTNQESMQVASRLKLGDIKVLEIGSLVRDDDTGITPPVVDGLSSRSLAYVIYTSGSTGTPKGAMNEHRAVVNRLIWGQKEFFIAPEDVHLQKTPYTFDVSVDELFWPIFTGAKLVIAKPEGHKDPEYIADIIQDEKITVINFVPTMLSAFLANADLSKCHSLRRVFCTGEVLPASSARRLREALPDCPVYNLYGPTETAVQVSCWEYDDGYVGVDCLIGKPVSNTCFYVLDSRGRPLPAGATGELYIGGVQVGRGYYRNQELTEQSFLPDPFQPEQDARMYRSGDLARWTQDGNIDFIGRKDFQVKLRGFRVELGEIESRLQVHPSVSEAVIAVWGTKTENMGLVAYYTLKPGSEMKDDRELATSLKQHLASSLPEYMIPFAYIRLEAMPVNVSGKLDRKQLPAPKLGEHTGHGKPLSETEKQIAELWQEIIYVQPKSADDSFFGFGGNSITAMRLISRLREEFKVELSMSSIFFENTLGEMAKAVEAAVPARTVTIRALPVADDYPASKMQTSLILMDEAHEVGTVYNLPGSIILPDMSGKDRLKPAIDILVQRHEVLRTHFIQVNGKFRQKIAARMDVEIKDLGEITMEEAQDAVNGMVRRFDLFTGPLFRVASARIKGKGTLVIFDFHHSIMDGFSIGIFANELQAIVNRKTLPPEPEFQYRDFCGYWEETQEQNTDRKYWLDVFRTTRETFLLPVDTPRTPSINFDGSTMEFYLDPDTVERVKRISQEARASMFAFFMSVFAVLQSRYSGKSRPIIGIADSGRKMDESINVLGPFVNMLPILADVEPGMNFHNLLKHVAERIAGAIDHSTYSYEDLVKDLDIPRKSGTNLLFQTVFAWQNIEEGHAIAESLLETGIESINAESRYSMYELHLIGRQTGDGQARFWLTYRNALYRENTIKLMIDDFVTVARQAVTDSSTRIADFLLGGQISQRGTVEIEGVLSDEDAFSFKSGKG